MDHPPQKSGPFEILKPIDTGVSSLKVVAPLDNAPQSGQAEKLNDTRTSVTSKEAPPEKSADVAANPAA